MTNRYRLLAAAATVAALAAPPALAQASVQVLIEQAGFWRGQGQPERAAAALDRALAAQPANPDVLAAAGLTQIELGSRGVAEDFLARLRQVSPGHAQVARLEEALRRSAGRETAAVMPQQAKAGLNAPDVGEVVRAEDLFEATLANDPNNAAALGGLGLARLRQGRAEEARDLLARALAAPGAEPGRWATPFDVAAFSVELSEARRQVAEGALDAGEALLLRAVRRETPDLAEAETLLGEIALRRGEATEAEDRFRAALYRRPALPTARRGLLESLRRQGRIAEADGLLRQAVAAGTAEAEALRVEATRTEDPAAALALLRDAVSASPANAWIRLDLARLLTRQGKEGEARAVLQEALSVLPTAEAAQAAALHAEEGGRFAEASRLLEQVPDRLRSADQNRLLRSLRWQVELAAAMAGSPAERRGAVLALAGRPDPTGEAGLRVVRLLARAGERDAAAEALRRMLDANRGATPAIRIALSGALADAGMTAEAGELLRPLAGLTAAQRRQMAALNGAMAPASVLAAAPAPRLMPVRAEPQRLYQGARDPQVAGRIAEAVLRRDPRNAEARIGAIEAALLRRDLEAAEMLLAEGRLLNASDPRVSVMEAQLARATGDRRRAQTALQLAADQRRAQISTGSSPAGSYRRTMLAGGGRSAEPFVPLDTDPASTGYNAATAAQLRSSDDPLLSEIGRQLAEVNEEASGRLVPNIALRSRSGDSGLDRLVEYGAGAEATVPLAGVGGQLSARVQAVTIDAGNLNSSVANLRRFGTNATVLPGTTGTISPQAAAALAPSGTSASGVAFGAAYARDGFTVDIGTTPQGFREQNILGGVEIAPRLNETLRLRLRGERRSMTDSLLSWSGMRDPVSGVNFGGVVRNTGYGQIEYSENGTSAYFGGGYSSVDGHNVVSNDRVEVNAGFSQAVIRSPTRELVAGLDLTYFAYDKNLRLFSLGHGGYFSPQNYTALSIPVDYRERRGNLAYRIGGSVGLAHFREDRAPYYPGNPGLQSVLEQRAAGDSTISAFYEGQSRTLVTTGIRGDIEYAITPSLRVGATARFDRSADFNETRGLVYARYRFDP
jgi:tetratricopeptide (TPR) repeat protein